MTTQISLKWKIPLEEVMDWPPDKKLLYAQSLASQNRFEAAQQEAMRKASEPEIESSDDFDAESFADDYGYVPGEDFALPSHAFTSPETDYDYDAQQAAQGANQHDETPENWHGPKPEPPEEDALEAHEADHLSKNDFHPDVARHGHMVKVDNDGPPGKPDTDESDDN